MNWDLFVQLLASGVVLGSTYALLGVSMSLIYATTRIFHLAHAAVYAVAAYAAVFAVHTMKLPLVPGLLFGIVVATALGVGIDRFGYATLRRRQSSSMVTFLFSLGLSIIAPNLLQITFGPDSYPLPGFPHHTLTFGVVRLTVLDLVVVAVSWACVAAVAIWLARSRYGRAITAVRTNEQMAVAVGVRVSRVYQIVFATGSALAAIAALLYTMGSVAQPNMGLEPILLAFVAVFIGGVGNTTGAAVGGLLLGIATDVSGVWLSSKYASAAAFVVLFVVLIVRPKGLFVRGRA